MPTIVEAVEDRFQARLHRVWLTPVTTSRSEERALRQHGIEDPRDGALSFGRGATEAAPH